MRIVAGAWRGRVFAAPKGDVTRPTSDRVRQALFDMLAHAPWAGNRLLAGAHVLDAFAGSGGLGLEALSRGAAKAWFIERDATAIATIQANIKSLAAMTRAVAIIADATRPPPGQPCNLVFLDPPYDQDLGPAALQALRAARWIAPGAVIVLEIGRDEALPELGSLLAERPHGAARITIWRGD
jgi:16S rRNA (guanine966-N2)-methyltransferase